MKRDDPERQSCLNKWIMGGEIYEQAKRTGLWVAGYRSGETRLPHDWDQTYRGAPGNPANDLGLSK